MRAAVVLSIAFLGSLVLSGCISGSDKAESGQSPARLQGQRVDLTNYEAERPLFSLKEIKPFVATAGDGIRLKGHVYVPDAPGPVPTILEYSPYHNSDAIAGGPSDELHQMRDGRWTMTGEFQALMDAGYAVAIVNIRGTGISAGCFQWGGTQDIVDTALVIETLAAMPHSDGQVGMIGTSYPGWTSFMGLASMAPSLKAVVPVSGVIDLHSLITRNGAAISVATALMPAWSGAFSLAEATYAPIDSRGGETNHLECGPTYANDWRESQLLATHGDRTPYWVERDIRDEIHQSKVPILFLNGVTDGEGHILEFEGLWEKIGHPDKRALLGQWGHGGTDHPTIDWSTMRLAWFDQYLRGTGEWLIPPGVVEWQDDTDQWHETPDWPPAHTATTVYLSDGTIVASGDDVTASTQMFQAAHMNPCLGVCTDGMYYAPDDLPPAPACSPFQALYVSPPLKEDVLLAGNFHVNLTVTSSLPDGNLAVYVYHTDRDGSCPDESAREVRRALTDLRHPQPGAAGADFPINTPTRVDIVSHPFAAPLKAGERIVVGISGGSMELAPDPRMPQLTISTGGDLVGQITFPVVEGTLAFE